MAKRRVKETYDDPARVIVAEGLGFGVAENTGGHWRPGMVIVVAGQTYEFVLPDEVFDSIPELAADAARQLAEKRAAPAPPPEVTA